MLQFLFLIKRRFNELRHVRSSKYHAFKIVKKVHDKRLRNILRMDDTLFCFMPCHCNLHAIFMSRRIQQECHARQKKLGMRLVGQQKATECRSRGIFNEKQGNSRSIGLSCDEPMQNER